VDADAAVPQTFWIGSQGGETGWFYQDTRTINLPGNVPLELVRIPGGTFMMGSPEDELSRDTNETLHEVTISEDYYLGRTEVTQQQWAALQALPAAQVPAAANLPVHNATLSQINDWIALLQTQPGNDLLISLPTEGQWERAARADTMTRFNFGDGFHPANNETCGTTAERESNVWYCGNAATSQPVGTKPANGWGLFDMHGNVWEWCSDFFAPYPDGPAIDPMGPDEDAGFGTVMRGGSWFGSIDLCRSARRFGSDGSATANFIGFRVAGRMPPLLTITSDVTEPIHQEQVQTLTFTFATDVTGFARGSIQLVGAAPGNLQAVTPRVYTMPITGEGGTITVTVPEGATNPTPYKGGATFSNFYQDTWTVNLPGDVPLELIRIPAGTYLQGSPMGELSRDADETQREVTISKDFYLGKTEVTQAQWLALAPIPVAQAHGQNGQLPIHNISWNSIMDPTSSSYWIGKLNLIFDPEGFGEGPFSLPTEAQWEYACRAGSTTRFSFGDGLHPTSDEECGTTAERAENLWYCGNTIVSQPVAQNPPNAWGLYDMHGNLAEWVFDRYEAYAPGPVTDPVASNGIDGITRGGSWVDGARFARSADRGPTTTVNSADYIGFRVAAKR
jgi:formylglycine-generating enzyme required for sulfatase activity